MTVVDEIKTLLLSAGTPFRACEGAADLAAAMKTGVKAHPVAFVFIGRDASGENTRATGGVLQRQERDISVVYVTGNKQDARGAAAADELETLKAFARGKLIGHVITSEPDGELVTHVEGALASFEHGFAWYEDVFSAPTYLTEQSS